MIVVRRIVAVQLLSVLTLVLVLTLFAHRVNATLLSPQFHQDQLTAIGAYEAIHDEVLPTALEDFLAEQEQKIPENLEGITLPTDAASQATVLDFARTALPPAYLDAQTSAAIDALIGYLRGERDDLDWSVSLNEPLDAAFLERRGPDTAFESMWSDLDLTNSAIAGLSRGLQVPEQDEAIRWFEGELFSAVGELSSYLAGDSEHVEIHIEFDRYPELAPLLATALNTDPNTLLRDGFRLNDVDIQRELDASDDPPIESLEDARAIFTPAGRTFGIDDFQRGNEETASTDGGGLDLGRVRSVVAPASTWAVPAGATAVVWLSAVIGVLGGRAWWSRATWMAGAIAGPALVIALLAGPVFGASAAPLLTEALAGTRTDLVADEASWAPLALRALDQAELVANQQANALAISSLLIALVAGALGGAATAGHLYATKRRTLEPARDAEPTELSPTEVDSDAGEAEESARAA